MLCCVLTCALLYLGLAQVPSPGQTARVTERAEQVVERSVLPEWKSPVQKKKARSGVARYSPLAAAGGYQGQTRTWYDALFDRLNPERVDWGAVFEQRKENFRHNVLFNPYFWPCAILLLLCAFMAFGWQVASSDRRIVLSEAGRQVSMLSSEADDCRVNALAAIEKYNAHVERCNLVAEALVSGAETPVMSDYAHLKQQFDRLEEDRQDKVVELARVKTELERERLAVRTLTARIDEVERRRKEESCRPQVNPNTELVLRINRLEEDLRRAKHGGTRAGNTAKDASEGEVVN